MVPKGQTNSSASKFGSDLSGLLSKLRPFQKEAYDFATQGLPLSSHSCISSASDASDASDACVQNGVEEAPQYDQKLVGNGRILLADEMGLGKTVTSLSIMTHYRQEWPLLILCPASLRYTWPSEIEKFLPSLPASSIYVVGGFDDADFHENQRKKDKIQIVIASYSLLQKRSAAARALQEFNFQCVIADESQNLKSRQSQRTQLAMPLLEGAKRLLLLSGTPALARPVELWPQISVIAPTLFAKNYSEFTKRYCNARRARFGWDVSGLSNAEELNSKLQHIMVRRLKCDVLKELPPKQRTIVPIQIPKGEKRKECLVIMKELSETRQSVSELMGPEADSAHFEARRLLMQAYQASGVAKSPAVCDYLLEWIRGSGTQKVLVFAHHKGVLDAIEVAVAKELKGVGHIRIDGAVNSQERATRVRKFQTSKSIRVAVLSMTAAGVGLTLTAASNVMFAELHWTPGVLAQAEDRCHRIGQVNAVNISYLVVRDSDLSIDMQLWGMLGKKMGNLGRLLDGQRNLSMNATLVDDSDDIFKGKSAQEELQTFFADAVPDNSKSKHAFPVKGTIMSFFQKQVEKSKETSGTGTTPDPHKKVSTPSFIDVDKATVDWACNACTFLNSEKATRVPPLICSMCKTPLGKEGAGRSNLRAVTPSTSSRKGAGQTNVNNTPNRDAQVFDDEEIIILDGHEGGSDVSRAHTECANDELVVLSDDPSSITHSPKKASHLPDQNLLFSVSKNSGRISIHYSSGESAHTNFEIDQVVTEETADRLLEAKTRRELSTTGVGTLIEFDQSAVRKVTESLNQENAKLQTRSNTEGEIELFVRNYVALRGIEKKILQESGDPFPGRGLKQKVALKMTQGESTDTTIRYGGGAKERAREKMEAGMAEPADLAVLRGESCAWCAGAFPAASRHERVEATYCSRDCAEEGRLRRGGMYASIQLRAQVYAMESGICVNCKIDAHGLYTRISALEPAERLNALLSSNFKLPASSKALNRLLSNPHEGDFWQVDHIRAVAEGGGDSSLDNLRTLCVPCHQVETEKLRLRLRLVGAGSDQSQKRRQRDIRSMFLEASQPSSRTRKKQKQVASTSSSSTRSEDYHCKS